MDQYADLRSLPLMLVIALLETPSLEAQRRKRTGAVNVYDHVAAQDVTAPDPRTLERALTLLGEEGWEAVGMSMAELAGPRRQVRSSIAFSLIVLLERPKL